MVEHVYLIGYPGDIGGACTEAWHTVKLWRRFGLGVTAVPTWKADPVWQERLRTIGCETVLMGVADFRLPAGSVAVSLCNHPFLDLMKRGALAGCRTVWVPCMTYLTDAERRLLAAGIHFDRYVFQSDYQRDMLAPLLAAGGVNPTRFRTVPGWLDVADFPFAPRPHRAHEPFIVGRLSRDDPRKFSPDLWKIYDRIPNVQAHVMGWSPTIERRCGKPPKWATVYPKGAMPAREFLGKLHAVVHPGGEAVENWPRFVLEAMAAGVPVVTDRSGGIPEMVRDRFAGLLCDKPEEMVSAAAGLAGDERWRMGLASMARRVVETVLCCPDQAWSAWQEVFSDMEAITS